MGEQRRHSTCHFEFHRLGQAAKCVAVQFECRQGERVRAEVCGSVQRIHDNAGNVQDGCLERMPPCHERVGLAGDRFFEGRGQAPRRYEGGANRRIITPNDLTLSLVQRATGRPLVLAALIDKSGTATYMTR